MRHKSPTAALCFVIQWWRIFRNLPEVGVSARWSAKALIALRPSVSALAPGANGQNFSALTIALHFLGSKALTKKWWKTKYIVLTYMYLENKQRLGSSNRHTMPPCPAAVLCGCWAPLQLWLRYPEGQEIGSVSQQLWKAGVHEGESGNVELLLLRRYELMHRMLKKMGRLESFLA